MLKRVKALAFMTFKCFTEKLEKYLYVPLHYTNQDLNEKNQHPLKQLLKQYDSIET